VTTRTAVAEIAHDPPEFPRFFARHRPCKFHLNRHIRRIWEMAHMDMQVIAIAARRLVVPALFAGITALGITGFAPDAAARDTSARMMASRSMPSHTAAHAATFRTASPQAAPARRSGAASGTYSQRTSETGGTATVSPNQLKRYSRFNESRH
jgi:hypothetical protein